MDAAARRLGIYVTVDEPGAANESADAVNGKPNSNLVWANSGRHVVGVGRAVSNVLPVMAFPRDNRGTAAEIVLLRLGLSHVSQKLRLTLAAKPAWQDGLLEKTLNMLCIEFFMVASDGKILVDGRSDTNADIGWIVDGGRLSLHRKREAAQFRQSLDKATSGPHEASILMYSDRLGAKRLAAVAPSGPQDQGLALVLFEDRHADQLALREHFFRAYGLTNSEMQVAKEVLDGKGLSEAAEATKYSLSTVRSYMKQVFAKTETHRQSELIVLYYKSILPVSRSIAAGDRHAPN